MTALLDGSVECLFCLVGLPDSHDNGWLMHLPPHLRFRAFTRDFAHVINI